MGELGYSTLRERMVDAIRVKILNGELKPGDRIIESDLSAEFGTSRGPIRESLRQIEQEGLIEYKRNAGCSVKEVTVKDIYEIYLLSSTYEILAVQSYNAEFTEEDFEKMDRILMLMKNLPGENYPELVSLDGAFHGLLVKKCSMPRLIKAWTDLEYGNIISVYAGNQDAETIRKRQYPIHKVIVDACRTKDVEKISAAITDHYMLTIKRLLKEEKEKQEQD